jgi:hypothetical protein
MINIFTENFFYLEGGVENPILHIRKYTTFLYFNINIVDYFIEKLRNFKVVLYHFGEYNFFNLKYDAQVNILYYLQISIKKSILNKLSFPLAKFIYDSAQIGGKLSGKIKASHVPNKYLFPK